MIPAIGCSKARSQTFRSAIAELIRRVAARDNDFDADDELRKIEFLVLEGIGEPQ